MDRSLRRSGYESAHTEDRRDPARRIIPIVLPEAIPGCIAANINMAVSEDMFHVLGIEVVVWRCEKARAVVGQALLTIGSINADSRPTGRGQDVWHTVSVPRPPSPET
jgi:hypothetical protein